MRINDQEYIIELSGNTFHCAMDVTMNYIGGKWKTVILWYLKNGPKRFSELRKHCPQISERMLSITLKQLEQDHIVKRKVHTKKPPLKVEYTLTAFGQTLIPILDEISKWGKQVTADKGKVVAV